MLSQWLELTSKHAPSKLYNDGFTKQLYVVDVHS